MLQLSKQEDSSAPSVGTKGIPDPVADDADVAEETGEPFLRLT